jgi:uncharacterized membrane protein YeaQ/YmgE (transglycosylase-associated protein family)
MDILILVGAMVVVGLIVTALAGAIWKGNRPYGIFGDGAIAIVTAVVVGLLDWYVIPAMGFGEMLRNIGIATEPALGALAVLWLVRRAVKPAAF